MKYLILCVLATIVTQARAEEVNVDEKSSEAIYSALVNAGAQPHGSSTISQTVMVSELGCSVGYSNQFHYKATVDCEFIDRVSTIKVSDKIAQRLLGALIQAKLIQHGPAEMSADSVKFLECTLSNFDGAKSYSCTAIQ